MTFAAFALPLLFAAFVWWFSTGAIMWLNRLPRMTHGWSFAAATVIAIAATAGLVASAGEASVTGAYVGFLCAIALWGWHEMSFLMGFILGSRRELCPSDADGWRRFRLAAATVMHHEVALALTLVALVAFSWGQPNQIGVLTFAILWVMRLSAKFNLFLGAPHRGDELLPAQLHHLKSYFRQRRMNALFPVSLIGGAVLAGALAMQAFAPGSTAFEQSGYILLFAITSLAVLEHVFMFVPPPNALLWGWAGASVAAPLVVPPARAPHRSAASPAE